MTEANAKPASATTEPVVRNDADVPLQHGAGSDAVFPAHGFVAVPWLNRRSAMLGAKRIKTLEPSMDGGF